MIKDKTATSGNNKTNIDPSPQPNTSSDNTQLSDKGFLDIAKEELGDSVTSWVSVVSNKLSSFFDKVDSFFE